MGVGILAKRVVLELGSSTNFVYSLKWGRGIFKNPPAPLKKALSLFGIFLFPRNPFPYFFIIPSPQKLSNCQKHKGEQNKRVPFRRLWRT